MDNKPLIASITLGIAVISFLSDMLSLFNSGKWIALGAVAIGLVVIVSKSLTDRKRNRQTPPSLTRFGFFYEPTPEWLTPDQRQELSDLAKAAFVLLLFEQTETGCWGKSYLPRHLAKGEPMPRAMGAITGTPFALMAISSYVERTNSETNSIDGAERLVLDSTECTVFDTLDGLLQPDGSYLKGYKETYPGRKKDFESPRHEAGACLIRMLYGELTERDFRTIERLCRPMDDPVTYDFAVVSRLFFQVPYLPSIPFRLRLRVALKRRKLLARLVREVQAASAANIAGKSTMRHESINQWSTASYILPLVTLPTMSKATRTTLIHRMQQFFSARSASSLTESSLLPVEIGEAMKGQGISAFGTGVGLLMWRTLERMTGNNDMPSKQAQKMLDRFLKSAGDAIEAPMSNPSPDVPEGYLGWGAICLGAASVGITIPFDDCVKAIALTTELKHEPVDDRSEAELEATYTQIIKTGRLLSPGHTVHVARAAAKLSFIYEPVRGTKPKTGVDFLDLNAPPKYKS